MVKLYTRSNSMTNNNPKSYKKYSNIELYKKDNK